MHNRLTGWLREHVILASLIIYFCSAFVRVGFASRMNPSELTRAYSDAFTYIVPANNLLEKGTFTNRDEMPEVARTPGYPAFLAVLLFFTNKDLRMALIAQAVILSFSVLFLYLLARKILSPEAAFLGGLIASVSPWGAVLAGIPMTDGLYLILLSMIFLIMKVVEESSRKPIVFVGAASVGLLTGYAVLVRPIWPLVLLIALALVFRNGVRRKGVVVLAIVLVFAVLPLFFWIDRNLREAQYGGLSTVPVATAWFYLAQRVRAQADGGDRSSYNEAARKASFDGKLYPKEYDAENWRQAMIVFREHPLLTLYCLSLSALEHVLHPEPRVLKAARLDFRGSVVALSALWGTLLMLALFGGWHVLAIKEGEPIDRASLLILFCICALLTLTSGVSFGAGSRLRAPMELIVPLLAAIGLVQLEKGLRRLRLVPLFRPQDDYLTR
jgi:hypothetical protein